MSRESDTKWFLDNRQMLAKKYSGLWLVILGGDIKKVLGNEEEAVEYSINEFGIDVASVFQANSEDQFIYIGAERD